MALYVLKGDDIHVYGQGVVECTVWRTNRCILQMHTFRKSLRWLGFHSKVFVSKDTYSFVGVHIAERLVWSMHGVADRGC